MAKAGAQVGVAAGEQRLAGAGGHVAQGVQQHLDLAKIIVVALAKGLDRAGDVILVGLAVVADLVFEVVPLQRLVAGKPLLFFLLVLVELAVLAGVEVLQALELGPGSLGLLPGPFQVEVLQLGLHLADAAAGGVQLLGQAGVLGLLPAQALRKLANLVFQLLYLLASEHGLSSFANMLLSIF